MNRLGVTECRASVSNTVKAQDAGRYQLLLDFTASERYVDNQFDRHTHSNLPLILAGGGGGALTPGRYVQHGSKPMTNLLLSMADKMGAQKLESFGDSTGKLENV